MIGEKRTDSYSNLVTGLGSHRDKTTGITSGDIAILEDEVLGQLYVAGGLLTTIVDNVPEDGLRNGWMYYNDSKGLLEDYCDNLNVKGRLDYAWKLQRIYNGSIIVMMSDNMIPEKPLSASEKITRLRVYSRARIHNTIADMNIDPKSKYFEEYEYFNITSKTGTTIKAHRSRCLVFKGSPLPDYLNTEFANSSYEYFGMSTIQKVWNDVKIYGASMQGIGNLLQELTVGKYTVDGLKQILAMNKREALEKILTRLEIMNASKSIINGVLLGENEKYERDTVNLSGVSDILDRFMMLVSSSAKQPVTKIFGKSASGLNATGENDLQQYYDMVSSETEILIKPQLNKLLMHLGKQLYGKDDVYGVEEFNSLWEMDEKQRAEIDKLKADTYQIYLQNNIITPEFVQEREFPELTETENINMELENE